MSPHAVNNFVSDLVLMAQAMERLPQVEAELNQSHKEVAGLANTVARREEHILELKGEVEALHTRIRELEVAKDAAETMFLEADDRTTRALDFIKASFGSAGALIQSLEPPKPEPVSEVKTEPTQVWPSDSTAPSEGQSELDPTAESHIGSTSKSETANESGVGQEGHASTPSWATPSPQPDMPPQPKPYEGRYYIDVPGWISRDDWLAGGGTEADYDYRG